MMNKLQTYRESAKPAVVTRKKLVWRRTDEGHDRTLMVASLTGIISGVPTFILFAYFCISFVDWKLPGWASLRATLVCIFLWVLWGVFNLKRVTYEEDT